MAFETHSSDYLCIISSRLLSLKSQHCRVGAETWLICTETRSPSKKHLTVSAVWHISFGCFCPLMVCSWFDILSVKLQTMKYEELTYFSKGRVRGKQKSTWLLKLDYALRIQYFPKFVRKQKCCRCTSRRELGWNTALVERCQLLVLKPCIPSMCSTWSHSNMSK